MSIDREHFTPGRWCQFHGQYCKEAEGTDYRQWDTSHDVSAILPDGTRYKVGHFRHAHDAAFVEKLVNDYQAGLLVRVPPPPEGER